MVRLSLTSPKRGTPWTPKALFGSGRQAQSPKPLPYVHIAPLPPPQAHATGGGGRSPKRGLLRDWSDSRSCREVHGETLGTEI